MRQRTAILLTFFLIGSLAARAGAVIVFPKGDGEPLKGRLVRMDDEVIVLQVQQRDGAWRERIIRRSAVGDVIVTVSEERLAALKPDNPKDYRDYAEELAEKREDPDARAAAIRLYLIAAYLDPENLGRSSLLGMTGLARSAGEQRKFQAMVYLLDPEHDRRSLRPVAEVKTEPADEDPEARQALLIALQNLRRDRRREALNVVKRPSVKKQMEVIQDILTYDQFVETAGETGKPLSNEMLRKVLTAELALRKESASVDEPGAAADKLPSWSQTIDAGATPPLPSLTLETLIPEFDPRKCQYRSGRWVVP